MYAVKLPGKHYLSIPNPTIDGNQNKGFETTYTNTYRHTQEGTNLFMSYAIIQITVSTYIKVINKCYIDYRFFQSNSLTGHKFLVLVLV